MKNSAIEAYSQMLSTENITVVFSEKASTAYFDVENREIVLPVYEFLGKNEQQMLASHEVAHAKFSTYTPEEVVSYNTEFGCLFNIIEDIYVESAIKREYPGLRSIFSTAYKNLYENNFFKVKGRTSSDFHFYDRINLFFKIGHIFPINFSQEESTFIVRCYQLSSNDDVIKLCRDIKRFCDQKRQNIEKELNNCSDDSKGSEGNDDSKGFKGSEGNDDSKGFKGSEGNDKSFTCKVGETINSFMESLKHAQQKKNKITDEGFFALSADIDINTSKMTESIIAENGINNTKELLNYIYNTKKSKIYEKFIKQMNLDILSVKRMSKDGDNYFHMLRNAKKRKQVKYRNIGLLDSKRLVKYKTSDNIFKRKLIVEKETNHGVVVFIDYSQSMDSNLDTAVIQAILICEFCKRNNIKFEVYIFGGFNRNNKPYDPNYYNYSSVIKIADNNNYCPEYLYMYSFKCYKFCNKYRIKYVNNKICLHIYEPGSTPLLRSAFVAYHAVNRLKLEGCDKTHVIFITDGENTDEFCYMSYKSTDKKIHNRCKNDINENNTYICSHIVGKNKKSNISINGISYDAIVNSKFSDSIFNAILKYTKEKFNTEITFSYILDYTYISKHSIINTIVDNKINEKLYNVNGVKVFNVDNDSFADNLIIQYKKKKSMYNNSLNENEILETMYKETANYSVFIKELAKVIA